MGIEQFSRRSRRRVRRVDDRARRAVEHGFTLIEVLIAVVLVGILAAVAVVAVGQLTDKAAAATCEQSADASRVATTSYYADHLRYPETFTELSAATNGVGGALVVPAGVTAAGSSLAGPSWALTMEPGSPPTFTCGPRSAAGASTTSTTSTTVAVTNGVTAAASTTGDLRYFGEQIVTLTNTAPLTAMIVTVSITVTPGLTSFRQYNTFWSETTVSSSSVGDGVVIYTFSLNPGQTIVPGTWTLASQWSSAGALHPTSGDTWSALTTSEGRTSTISGGF